MPLTPQQQYQLLLSIIEEALRLAQKFGLNDGAVMLEEFKKTIQNATNPQSLFSVIDQEKLFKKAYKEKRVQLNQLIANVFGFDLPSKKVDEEFKKILSPSEKEVKKIIKDNDGVFDLNKLIAYVKENARNYIKPGLSATVRD